MNVAESGIHPAAGSRRSKLALSRVPAEIQRLLAAAPLAILLMIPDSEIHAKVFKVALILDNLNQRLFST